MPSLSLQWRAGQLPGRTSAAGETVPNVTTRLQWRAGQLPGRTPQGGGPTHSPSPPSMEGRAIARPNTVFGNQTAPAEWPLQWRAGQLPGRTGLSYRRHCYRTSPFNGGPGNCPAEPDHVNDDGTPLTKPSMEGRAIARPNCRVRGQVRQWPLPSMEGRAIARPNRAGWPPTGHAGLSLQWRAGQLPGRTALCMRVPRSWRCAFNGGPGNCPAERWTAHPSKPTRTLLQWRAGQLPGRTTRAYCG